MPDDDDDTGAPEPWDRATEAVPAEDPGGEVTQSVPGDVTQAIPPTTPPTATTPLAAGGALGVGGATPAHAVSRPARPNSQRALIIAVVVAAVLVVGAGIALAVTGGTTPKKAAGGTPNIPATTAGAPAGPTCPLTGVATTGASVPQRPALAVKVDNYPQARPQSGIDQADIVFEEPVEGGITRLVAVFQCQSPALIGPIRSARAVDVQILDQLSRPILIHAGGINPVLDLLQNANLIDDNVFAHGSIVQNPPGRYAPYDTYVSAAAAWGLDPTDTTPPKPLFTYSPTTPAGTPVTSIHIPFTGTNNTLWTWNAARGRWLLSYSGVPAMDADGAQIATTNIVVQTVHVTYGPWLENNVGGLEVQSQMTGSGPVTVLRDGVAITGTWQRPSVNDPTTLTASDGSTIALQPGQTWVEIVPSTVSVTTTSPTASSTTTHP
ncbi:MAG TPA: DUF3048 domain-containing protein [Acidimicrobiales bacterium]|nr:DUF3048 domain-containing protein [Acidimicrobiales bacterium]